MTKMFVNFEKIKWFRLQVLSPNPLVKKKKNVFNDACVCVCE